MLIALLNVPDPAEPGPAVRAHHRRAARLPVVQRPPGPDLHGRLGSLALGATLAVTALITGQILVLPLIGIIFVIETMSVIIQIGYFKLTGGKRIFRMTPLHHHFELAGWDEEKITIRFWIIGILAALLGVTLFLASLDGCGDATMTTGATDRPRRADAGRRPRRRPARPAGDGARPRPERHRAGPLPRRRGAASRSTTAARPTSWPTRSPRSRAAPVDAGARARTSTRRPPGPAPPWSRRRRRSTRTTRRPSRGCGRRCRRWSPREPAATRRARRSSPRPTCSCASARRRRSASPARRARRRRRR